MSTVMLNIFVYRITNTINGKEYIGVHTTDDIDDGYFGSGQTIKAAIRKYGKQSFTKEILKHFDTVEEAYHYESVLVTEEYIKSGSTYNMTPGGKIPPSQKGIPKSPSAIKKLKEYYATDEGKLKQQTAGLKGWQSKGKWSDEEISKRTATRKANNTYSTDMSACHTVDAIAKRIQTRKIKGVAHNTTNCHTDESKFKREKTKVLKVIDRIVKHYGVAFSMDLLKQARKERVAYLSDKTLAKYITEDDYSSNDVA